MMDNYKLRYSRQTLFSEITKKGQEKLSTSRVAVIGCGALGSASAELLVRAGIGEIVLVDKDTVELSNLPRQSLYTEKDATDKIAKATAARNHLQQINSAVKIEEHIVKADNKNIDRFVKDFDCVVDGTDNFETRYIINESCIRNNTAWVYTGVVKSEGTLLTVIPKQTPCLSCIFPTPPKNEENANTSGILNTTVSFASSLQVTEVIKILLGKTDQLTKGLVLFDLWHASLKIIPIEKPAKGKCSICG